MRRAFLALIIATGLADAAPARADVSVGSSAGAGVVLHPEGDNGWRVVVEHFADGSRNGFRVR